MACQTCCVSEESGASLLFASVFQSPAGMDPSALMIDCYGFRFYFNAFGQRDVISISNLPRVPLVLEGEATGSLVFMEYGFHGVKFSVTSYLAENATY